MLNKPEFDLAGITLWHERGYLGDGVALLNGETCKDMPWFDGMVEAPEGFLSNSDHGTQTMDVVHQVAPSAKKYSLSVNVHRNGGQIEHNYGKVLELMRINNVCVFSTSLSGHNYPELFPVWDAIAKGCAMVTSAGNTSDETTQSYADSGKWIPVAAYHLTKGNLSIANYSSPSRNMMCAGLSNLNIHTHSLPWDGRSFRVTGTSFSTPMVAGQIALVQGWFKQHTGKTLNHEQVERFIADNCHRGEWDERTGYGLFVLPDPDTINQARYLEEEDMKKVIEMWIGRQGYLVDGESKVMDVPPVITNGRTLVPLRAVAEAFGAQVDYEPGNQKITITMGD